MFTAPTKCSKRGQVALSLPLSLAPPQPLKANANAKKEKAGNKNPSLAKQMNTLATASTSGERYANECSMCLRAGLPDAGEPGPTGGT